MENGKISGSGLPGYHQIRRYVFSLIAAAKPGGELIPLTTERELCELFGMSRGTVRKALQMLTDEGLLLRRQHYGTFISPRAVRCSLHMPMIGVIVSDGENSFYDNMSLSLLGGLYRELGCNSFLVHPIQFFGNPEQTLEAELKGRLSGIVWFWMAEEHGHLADMICENGIPLLHVIPRTAKGGGTRIMLDLERYSYELASGLISKGHVNDVLYLDTNSSEISEGKLKGIRRAYAEAGAVWEEDNYVRGSYAEIWDCLETRLNSSRYRIVNATGAFDSCKQNFPHIDFIVPRVSANLCPDAGTLPCVAIPAFETGELAGKMMRTHINDPVNAPMRDSKVALQVVNNRK